MAAESLNLSVHGMMCANCARTVERKLSSTPGVTRAVVELQGERALVEYDSELVQPDVIRKAVSDLGYQVSA
jgi:copper chaperone CopZ